LLVIYTFFVGFLLLYKKKPIKKHQKIVNILIVNKYILRLFYMLLRFNKLRYLW